MTHTGGDTGRIRRTLSTSASQALRSHRAVHNRSWELTSIAEVDRAHLVMLAQAGLLDAPRAARILAAIDALIADRFRPLHDTDAPRGVYLMYESYLIDQLGESLGGALHTGRSRNDLNATVLRLQLRDPVRELIREALRLVALLLARARRFSTVVMPVYTHYQAALPGSYGHYLAAIALSLQRSAAAFLTCIRDGIDACPLGAGAATGTSLPIRTELTAKLLGFGDTISNSLDAVASRDFVLRLLSEATILGVTLSRLATDMQLWTTAEFGFLSLPDSLVGSSSMMPQKRNPYLLEHVQGRSAHPLGAFVAAVGAMHAKPYTNNIAAGTESLAGLWDALATITSATRLARLCVMGAVPQPIAMRQRAEGTFLEATEICNRLVRAGISFRTAHHLVGRAISDAIERGEAEIDGPALLAQVSGGHPGLDRDALDLDAIMRASFHGGGPGRILARDSFDREIATARAQSLDLKRWIDQWQTARRDLDREAAALCGTSTTQDDV